MDYFLSKTILRVGSYVRSYLCAFYHHNSISLNSLYQNHSVVNQQKTNFSTVISQGTAKFCWKISRINKSNKEEIILPFIFSGRISSTATVSIPVKELVLC